MKRAIRGRPRAARRVVSLHPHAAGGADDAAGDAAPDVFDAPADAEPDAPPPAFCPPDPHLRLCFSFDDNPLPGSLPEQGAATNPATLTDVTWISARSAAPRRSARPSSIVVAQDTDVYAILAAEVWFRMDTDAPANAARESLFDSNIIPPNISMFVYRNDPHHDLHCGIGSQSEIWTTDAIMLEHLAPRGLRVRERQPVVLPRRREPRRSPGNCAMPARSSATASRSARTTTAPASRSTTA